MFVEISFILAIATVMSLLMRLLKQPLVVGYILTGIIAGPVFLDLIHSVEILELFSKLGITMLLFIIGLHLNPQVIKEVGVVSLITGLGQIFFTSLVGWGLAIMLGFSPIAALFIALALTFSSTIIILKLLADKGDLNALYGKISVGFLLVQDLAASIILMAVSLISHSGDQQSHPYYLVTTIGGIVSVFLFMYLISRHILPRLISYSAKSAETLFIFCISWGLIVASVFLELGLSVEIGALVAGVSLSTTAFSTEISSRLRPLRDFFVVVFFILLGSQIVINDIQELLLPALLLSTFVLVGNPLIVFFLMNVAGYHRRTSFLAGLTVAQISEFSLILIGLAYQAGFVETQAISLVTLIGLITIAVSSYMIIYSNNLYLWLSPILARIAPRRIEHEKASRSQRYKAILFGYGRVGRDYVKLFKKQGWSYLIVDFDPQVIKRLQQQGHPAEYGDADDVEFLAELPLKEVELVISTISNMEADLLLAREVRQANPKATIIAKSKQIQDSFALYEAGVSYVVMPHYLGAQYALRMISRHGLGMTPYKKLKEKHLAYLENRLATSLI